MSEISDTKRLADAINALAVTMTEIMTERMRMIAEDQKRKIGQRMIDPLLNKREIAQRLRFSVRSVDGWMKRGLIPYLKIGRSVRFRWSEVERHLGALESRGVVRLSR
jgi:excisionase family DNA binding protein